MLYNESLREDLGRIAYENFTRPSIPRLPWDIIVLDNPQVALDWCRAAEAVQEIVAEESH